MAACMLLSGGLLASRYWYVHDSVSRRPDYVAWTGSEGLARGPDPTLQMQTHSAARGPDPSLRKGPRGLSRGSIYSQLAGLTLAESRGK